MTLNLYTLPTCGISHTNSDIATVHTLCDHVENASNQLSQYTISGKTYLHILDHVSIFKEQSSRILQFIRGDVRRTYTYIHLTLDTIHNLPLSA